MGIRRIARYHKSRHVIRFYSKKSGCALVAESFLELWYLCKLENDPLVKKVGTQVETMQLIIDGKKRSFTPDFLVLYTDNSAEYIEIHNKRFITDEYKEKVALFNRHCERKTGLSIRLIIESDLKESELVNYQLIASRRSLKPDFIVSDYTFPNLTSFGSLIEQLESLSSQPIEDAYHLVSIGFYQFNVNKMLRRDTPINRSAAS